MKEQAVKGRYLYVLALGALGVVFGDIGTSPLYAIRECFYGPHAVEPSRANILGVLSLIFWSLIIVISIKYIVFVMRADNRGEGGILALTSLATSVRSPGRRSVSPLLIIGLFGTALLYGDGMITPAISVLSAVEGLEVATPFFDPYVIPITIAILVGLFSFQKHGTGRVGAIFGPVMLVWFGTLALLGLVEIIRVPAVIAALNPLYGAEFFLRNGWPGFLVLGSVFLVVTGGEALYADMGHFGRVPIRLTWFAVVLPALLLNYFGQGALLITTPEAAEHPFYRLAPAWMLYPLVGLATGATVIASQAMISGAFSLTRQAIQLGYSPRLDIDHTSAKEIGQIYVPAVNWVLMLACIGLVLGFRSSSNLAAAYGVAVTTDMVFTTILFSVVARRKWGWNAAAVALLATAFLIVDLSFWTANITKIGHGGWFPLVIGAIVYTLLSTWKRGRQLLGENFRMQALPFELFFRDIESRPPARVPGAAVFMTRTGGGVPSLLLHHLKHNKVLHEQVILLTVEAEEVPHVPPEERVEIEEMGNGFYRLTARYGFMEDPTIADVLERSKEKGLTLKLAATTFYLGRETLITTKRPGLPRWRKKLFALMSRNARSAASFFHIPPNRVVEMGAQIEL